MLKLSGTNRQRAATLLMAVLCLVVVSQAVVLAQNLGAAPQVKVASSRMWLAAGSGDTLSRRSAVLRFRASRDCSNSGSLKVEAVLHSPPLARTERRVLSDSSHPIRASPPSGVQTRNRCLL